jgi:hypothetical protein
MIDLTVIYITANEMPGGWVAFQLDKLFEAIGNTPIISVSREPMAMGKNILDTEPKSYWNMYMQILNACMIAKTPYIGIAEDDTLYTKAHFTEFRPSLDAVAYDRSRWSLFSWDKIYCMRQRISNCSLIAAREYLINALQERKEKWPNPPPENLIGEVGRAKVDKRLGVSIRNCVEWYSYGPIVQLNHPNGTDDRQQRLWKRHGQMRAYDIPFWGKATDILRKYHG